MDDEEEMVLKERIEADVDPLVKYCLLQGDDINNPESFFSLPQEVRTWPKCVNLGLAVVINSWHP